MRINAIKLAKILEGREISPLYGMGKNLALHLLRLSGANFNFDEKDKYLAEFISEQEEIDQCILSLFFEKIIDNDLLHNPECKSAENKQNIRDFLNKEIFINGFEIDSSNKISQNLIKIKNDLPETTKIINETHNHIYNNNKSENNMSSQDQNINGHGNQVAQAGDGSIITQTASFSLQFDSKQFEIEDEIDKVLADKDLDEKSKKRLVKIKEELENVKTEDEKKGVLAKIGGVLKNIGSTIAGVETLKTLVLPLLKLAGLDLPF